MTSRGIDHVTIKLGLLKTGEENVFRRIPVELLGLNASNNTAGVDVLKRYAILMFEGTCDISSVNVDDYKVILMYKDIDDDKVLLYTDYDIIAALNEYSDVGKVKILAEVTAKEPSLKNILNRASVSTQTSVLNTEKTTEATTPSTPPTPIPSASTPAPSTSTPSTPTIEPVIMFGTSPHGVDLSASLAQIISGAATAAASAATSAVNSKKVTDALNKAAAAMEEQAKKVSAAAESKANEAATAFENGGHAAARHTERAARHAARFARHAARHARRAGTPASNVEYDVVVDMENSGATSPSSNTGLGRNAEFVAETTSAPPASAPRAVPEPAHEPPVEERPFIHGRHTCDGCLTTPIIGKRFHAVNLPDYDLCERCMMAHGGSDIRFDEAKLDRDLPMQDRWHMRRARFMGGRGGLGGRGGRCGRRGRDASSFFYGCAPIPPPAPQHPLNDPPKCRDSTVQEENDLALKEAILRSLMDQQTVSSSPKQPKRTVEVETVNENEIDEDEVKGPAKVVEKQSVASVVAEPVVVVAVATEPEIVVPEAEAVAPAPEPEIVVLPEVTTETSSPDFAASQEDIEAGISTTSSKKKPETTTLLQPEFYSFIGESFGGEAEGSTAAMIGSTLDKMAEAIEGLAWQLDCPVQEPAKVAAAVSNDESDDDDSLDSNEEGAKIVDGSDDDDDDDSSDSSSWHVVPGEEQIGRAAYTLGSALFNSDMQRSSENVANSAKSGFSGISDVFDGSTVSSVPTTIRSLNPVKIVAAVQLERWSAQLQQLHELGFNDDAQSVDILETLNAANIGVDSNDEVSVEQVINVLMKDS